MKNTALSFRTNLFALALCGFAGLGCAAETHDSIESKALYLSPETIFVNAGDYFSATDSDPTNNGASGSPQCDRGTDVDFWHNSEPGTDGCHIGWTEPGEVLSYPLGSLIDEAGHYDIVLRLGSAFSGKQVRARVVYMGDKGTPTVAEADVTAEAQGWGVFADGLAISDLSLPAHGAYILEIEHLTGGLDFNGFELRPSIESTIVEAEDYFTYSDNTVEDSGASAECTRGDGVDLEVTSDPKGGACNVGWGEAGESLHWYIDVPQSGEYKVVARVASQVGGSFNMYGAYLPEQGTLQSPDISVNTGGWQNWQDVTVFERAVITVGPHRPPVWNFNITESGINLNYLELIPLRLCEHWSCSDL